nr:hypothetical protein [Pseudomonadales bacterium]
MIAHADSNGQAILVVNATFDLLLIYGVSFLLAVNIDVSLTLGAAKDHRHMMPFVIVKPTVSVVTNCSWSSLSAVP